MKIRIKYLKDYKFHKNTQTKPNMKYIYVRKKGEVEELEEEYATRFIAKGVCEEVKAKGGRKKKDETDENDQV